LEKIASKKKINSFKKELSTIIYELTGNDKNFGIIRSKGDALYVGINKLSASIVDNYMSQNVPRF